MLKNLLLPLLCAAALVANAGAQDEQETAAVALEAEAAAAARAAQQQQALDEKFLLLERQLTDQNELGLRRLEHVEERLDASQHHLDRLALVFALSILVIFLFISNNLRTRLKSAELRVRRASEDAQNLMRDIERELSRPEVHHLHISQILRRLMRQLREKRETALTDAHIKEVRQASNDPYLPVSLYLIARVLVAEHDRNWSVAVQMLEQLREMDAKDGDVLLHLSHVHKHIAVSSVNVKVRELHERLCYQYYGQFTAVMKAERAALEDDDTPPPAPALPDSTADSEAEAPQQPTPPPAIAAQPATAAAPAITASAPRAAPEVEAPTPTAAPSTPPAPAPEPAPAVPAAPTPAVTPPAAPSPQTPTPPPPTPAPQPAPAAKPAAKPAAAPTPPPQTPPPAAAKAGKEKSASRWKWSKKAAKKADTPAATDNKDQLKDEKKSTLPAVPTAGRDKSALATLTAALPAPRAMVARLRAQPIARLSPAKAWHACAAVTRQAVGALSRLLRQADDAPLPFLPVPATSVVPKVGEKDELTMWQEIRRGDLTMAKATTAHTLRERNRLIDAAGVYYAQAQAHSTNAVLYHNWGIALLAKALHVPEKKRAPFYNAAVDKFLAGNVVAPHYFDFHLASLYAIIGNKMECQKWLHTAREHGNLDVEALRQAPDFDLVRQEPWFKEFT